MNIKPTIVFLVLLISHPLHMSAQTGFGASGGNVLSDEYGLSYSVGQVCYTSASPSAYYLSQGLQHPSIVGLPNGIEQLSKPCSFISIVPNPVIDKLQLKINTNDTSDLYFKLYNSLGELVSQVSITTNELMYSMAIYPQGLYLLIVMQNQKVIRSFKILKK